MIKNDKDVRNVTNLSFQLHAITKMDGQLSNKAERMLIRSLVIKGENLRSGVLHESDRRQGMSSSIPRRFK
jgi:hypothetical protein